MLTAITPSIGPDGATRAAHRAGPHRRGHRHLHRAARGDHPFRERAAVLRDGDRGGPVPDAGDGSLPDGARRRRPGAAPRGLRPPHRPAGRGRDDGPVARLRREAAPDPADRHRRGSSIWWSTPSSSIRGRRRPARSKCGPSRRRRPGPAPRPISATPRRSAPARSAPRSSWRASTTACCPRASRARAGSPTVAWRRWPTNRTSTTTGGPSPPGRNTSRRSSSMDMTMVLEGEYRDVRRFIHKLETAPEFVVIDDVAPGAGREERAADLDRQAVDLLQGGVVMEPAQRTRWIQLGVLGVVLVAVVYFVLMPALATPVVPAGPLAAAAPGGRAGGKPAPRPIDVRLDALGKAAAAEDPEGARRNPFRMGAATPPPAPEGTMAARTPPKPVAPVVLAPVAAAAAAPAADPVPVHRRAHGRAGTGTHRRADRRPQRGARPGERHHRGTLPHRADRRGIAPDRALRWARPPDDPSAGTIDRMARRPAGARRRRNVSQERCR